MEILSKKTVVEATGLSSNNNNKIMTKTKTKTINPSSTTTQKTSSHPQNQTSQIIKIDLKIIKIFKIFIYVLIN